MYRVATDGVVAIIRILHKRMLPDGTFALRHDAANSSGFSLEAKLERRSCRCAWPCQGF
ncbi:hypothetical protein [Halopseudomonas sp.]|uniref:hypothetical protein n=1 Tax=Halopseudomonas sp. TaxID=2901191 RepID=UPI003FA526FF